MGQDQGRASSRSLNVLIFASDTFLGFKCCNILGFPKISPWALSPETVLGHRAVLEAQLGSMWGCRRQSHRESSALRKEN